MDNVSKSALSWKNVSIVKDKGKNLRLMVIQGRKMMKRRECWENSSVIESVGRLREGDDITRSEA